MKVLWMDQFWGPSHCRDLPKTIVNCVASKLASLEKVSVSESKPQNIVELYV